VGYYDPLPPSYYDDRAELADEDLTELGNDDERHWRAIAELMGANHDDD
jgi:hypothetical protein